MSVPPCTRSAQLFYDTNITVATHVFHWARILLLRMSFDYSRFELLVPSCPPISSRLQLIPNTDLLRLQNSAGHPFFPLL